MSQPEPAEPGLPVQRPVARHRLPANVRLAIALGLLLLLIFQLLRLGLMLRVDAARESSWPLLIGAFVTGLRFDASASAVLLAPVLLVCYIPWISPWSGRRRRSIFAWGLTLLLGVLILIELAEFEFVHEFQSRYNELAIRYFDHPKIVIEMAWYGFPVYRYTLAWIVLLILLRLGIGRAMRWAGGPAPQRAARRNLRGFEVEVRSPAATNETSPHHSFRASAGDIAAPTASRRRVVEVAGALLLVAAVVIAARGGFQQEPLQWGDAYRGDNEIVNRMSLNGLWCLAHTAMDMANRGQASSGWEKGLPPDEAARIARELFVAPGETMIAPDRTALRRIASAPSTIHLQTRDGRPANVVVVMMESFSARFCGATGAPRSFTPFFDRLAKDGRLFDRAFSAGTHTHQGIFATQLGFPNLPGYESLMSSGISNQEFCSLSSVFQNRGYRTFFLYNGDFSWDNMRGFFRKQGVDTFIGGDEMLAEAKYRDHVWGVSDGDLFDRCNREFDAAAKNGPFMAAVMTLSNHAPFEVPPVPDTAPITDMNEYNARLQAMRYADWSVGQFIETARKLPYFQDTLFVFVGDHGFAVPPKLTEVNLLYHHVPLLFYAPGLVGGSELTGIDHRVAAQMNIVPSVLGLLGLTDVPYAAWARSLFDGRPAEESSAIFKLTGGGKAVGIVRNDDMLVLDDARAEPHLLTYTLWPPAVTPATDAGAPERRKAMTRELRAYVQAAIKDLSDHKAGPIEPARGASTK